MQRRIHTRISTSNQVRRNGEQKIVQTGSEFKIDSNYIPIILPNTIHKCKRKNLSS